MTLPAMHGWTHRPKAQGGTDPIEFPDAGSISWAKAWMSSTSISNASSYFRPRFQFLATNDTALFELASISSNAADYLQINGPGYYELLIGVVTSAGWGANYTNLEGVYAESGTADFQFNTATDAFTDFTESDYAAGSEQHQDEFYTSPNAHRGLWKMYTFRYQPAAPGASSLSDEDPLRIALRTTSDAAGPITMTAGLYIKRISDPDYTLTDLT
jgi:hypothetical protein